jgi:hypothetical protein
MPQGEIHRITVTEKGTHGVIQTGDHQTPFVPFDVDYRLDLLKVGDPVRWEFYPDPWAHELGDGTFYGQLGAIKVKLDVERQEFLRIKNQATE